MSTSARVSSNSCTLAFSVRLFWGESETKGRNREGMRSGFPPLDSASSARHERPQPNYGRQWTGLRPAPQPRASRSRGGFGGQLKLQSCLDLFGRREPLSLGRPKRVRNSAPGYSWPPHLYQEKSSVGHRGGKCQQKFQALLSLRPERVNEISDSLHPSNCCSPP